MIENLAPPQKKSIFGNKIIFISNAFTSKEDVGEKRHG